MHQLRYFIAVAEEGNFTRAAQKSFVSQPSLSSQIIKLEDELGQKLFNRLGRRAELTEAGRILERRARSILLDVENAEKEIQLNSGDVKGRLSVGSTPSVAPYLLPPVIAYCQRTYPDLDIRFEEDLRRPLMRNLVEGDLEVAICSYPGDNAHIEAEPILQEALLLVANKGHPLARKTKVSINDFKSEPLVMLGESNTLGEKVLEFFDRNDFKPKIACICSQVKTVKALVQNNVGLAILPEMARGENDGFDIAYKSLVSARMNRLVFALTYGKRYLSPGGRSFIDAIRRYADGEALD